MNLAASFTLIVASAASQPASQLVGLASEGGKPFLFGGYVELDYQWNFNNPANRVTAYRGFDNLHNSFEISNVAVDAQMDYANVVARLTLQVGQTPNTYYQSEPGGADGWKYIQQAYAGYRIPVGRGLLAQFGIYLSPIGPENMPVKDDWNWSRSNLFFGLPFYHAGGRLMYPFSDRFSLTAAVYNGWNNVIDNNAAKSLSLQALYSVPDRITASVLYFTGIERDDASWRHLLDAHVTLRLNAWLELLAHVNGGFEPNVFGVSAWACGAAYLRFQVLAPLFIAVRGDFFFEHVPLGAAPIFWPVPWVAEGTLTVDYRPIDRISLRLEYRHDHAAGALYTVGHLTRAFQDTLTFGVTGWL